MINSKTLSLAKNLDKLLFLVAILFTTPISAENLPLASDLKPISSPSITTTPIQQASLPFNRPSQKEIEQMKRELEDLIHRVESTLITVEAKQVRYNTPMTAVADYMLKNPPKSNVTNKENKSNQSFSNNKASEAIANARQVLQDFPTLALQNYSQARQIWLDARRNLWDSYPVDRHFAQPEVRAMWVDRGTIVKAKSKQDLAPLFDRMAESGINTVFLETVNSSYPIYPSRVAPEQNPMTKGWDPLQASIELAHERGMELHAWAWIFAAANQGHNRILGQPENYLGPVLSRNPSWVLKDQNGAVFNRTPGFKKAFFDPANPQVRNYLLALLEEIATNYDVDGIQLDYIRYPFQDGITKQQFGYTNVSQELFKQTYGIDPKNIKPSSPLWSQWTGFRIRQITSFVSESSQRLKAKRPNLVISTAVFPIERRERLSVLQQNWEDWIDQGYVDMMLLMTYALHTGSFEDRTKSVYEFSAKNSSLIIPGIRLLNVPNAEAFDQMQSVRNMPSGGFALFAAENFNPALGTMFKQTQGNSTEMKEPLPHRQPFQSAVSRYEALQKEWNFMLLNHQMTIDPRFLKEWSQQADQLGDRLKNLAQNPTSNNLIIAQKELSSLKMKLPNYLGKYKQQQPLQLDTWMNRLITLENLLQYGERTIIANQIKNNNISTIK
ncbi:family 10 glycosylhydrolase [Geminocystis sp. GBBB08]|uniref:glycoside hydrolase family 10 protein n=1 Tax=Geminocystis sp. GBBB08 TaxID=2604140 RepID=UPI0027E36130|nr:family 10 glycosylhydrolase [Geminocystis sp. GBBB08]MBL1209429.1 family 10 glycosylhydrolase [Geminocystis sp. GBBB08]